MLELLRWFGVLDPVVRVVERGFDARLITDVENRFTDHPRVTLGVGQETLNDKPPGAQRCRIPGSFGRHPDDRGDRSASAGSIDQGTSVDRTVPGHCRVIPRDEK
jgi:hypothetical protein